jgi:hypothetical protein
VATTLSHDEVVRRDTASEITRALPVGSTHWRRRTIHHAGTVQDSRAMRRPTPPTF